MGKSTISMVIFNSYVSHYQRGKSSENIEHNDSMIIWKHHSSQLRLKFSELRSSNFSKNLGKLASVPWGAMPWAAAQISHEMEPNQIWITTNNHYNS